MFFPLLACKSRPAAGKSDQQIFNLQRAQNWLRLPEFMNVITISRQLGVQGLAISKKIASRLGYTLYWREIINQAALRCGTPDVALAVIDELGLLDVQPSREALDNYHKAVREIIEEFAAAGNAVILGRAGQVILKDHPAVLHIRLFATQSFRAAALASQNNISIQSAQAQVTASDEYRRDYLLQNYGVDWQDPALYHLIINMGKFTQQQAVDLIIDACQQPAKTTSPSS